MNLLARNFEKRARALHRAELDKTPELRAEFKRLRRSESSALNRAARRALMPLFWNFLFLNIALKTKDQALTAAVITLWAAASAFRWGYHWFQQFYGSEELVVLNLLPLNDRQVFRFQTGRYLKTAGWTAWEMLLAYGVLGIVAGENALPFYLYPVAAILQALLILALALHAASRLHMLPLNGIAALLYSTAIALLILGNQQVTATALMVQASNWFFPTGWLNYILLGAQGDLLVLGLLVPIAGIIYLARFSWQRLQMHYSLEGFEIVPSASRGINPADHTELTADSFGHRAGPTEIEDRVSARAFLGGVNWEMAGWLERLASRLLNSRERIITEFLVAQDPGWTRSFRWSFWVWLVACVVVSLLGHLSGTLVFFIGYILATASLPLFGGDWRGMRQSHTGGVNLPAFALYPIAFNSIAWILLKVNLLRILAAVPAILSFSALAAWRLEQHPLDGAVVGGKLIAILICLQPLFVLLPISSTTNSTSRMRAAWILGFLPVCLALLGCGIAVFMSKNFAVILLCYLLIAMGSALLFVVYRRSYRLGHFDLFNRRGP